MLRDASQFFYQYYDASVDGEGEVSRTQDEPCAIHGIQKEDIVLPSAPGRPGPDARISRLLKVAARYPSKYAGPLFLG